jgi:hypothetical protein
MNQCNFSLIHKGLESFVRSWAKDAQQGSSELTIEADESKLPEIAEALREILADQPSWLVFSPWLVDGIITATPDAVVEVILAGANEMNMTSVLSIVNGSGFTFDISDGADGVPVVSVAGWGDLREVIKSIGMRIEGAMLFDSRIGNP